MRKVILYSCGSYYRIIRDDLKECEKRGQFQILGISDKNSPPGDELDGWKLIPREKIPEYSFDNILILSPAYEREIREELIAMGVDSRAFDYQVRTKYWDRSLNGISILCNNCWGGYAAQTLGIECCSPTKNLWFSDHAFIRFLENLEYYLSLDPVPAGWSDAVNRYDADRYPLLKVGDILLHCNHDTSAEEAIEKWQRRKRKVHPENMIAVYITDHPDLEEAFYRIGRIEKKYCLVPWESSFPHSVRIPEKKGRSFREAAVDTGKLSMGLNLSAMMRNMDDVIIREDLYRD